MKEQCVFYFMQFRYLISLKFQTLNHSGKKFVAKEMDKVEVQLIRLHN